MKFVFIILAIAIFFILRYSKAFIVRLSVVIFIITVVALYTGKFKILIGLIPLGALWLICAVVIRQREQRKASKKEDQA